MFRYWMCFCGYLSGWRGEWGSMYIGICLFGWEYLWKVWMNLVWCMVFRNWEKWVNIMRYFSLEWGFFLIEFMIVVVIIGIIVFIVYFLY